MLGTLKARVFIILAVVALCGWSLYDTYSDCMETPAEVRGTCSPVKLGLDLQGGMHLVMEVEDPEGTMTAEARADATDRALRIIRTRVDEFGVSEPLIQKVGSDRIIVELPGIRDEARAKEIIRQTAFLEFKLVTSARRFVDALPRIDQVIIDSLGTEAVAAETGETARERQELQDLVFGQEDTAAADQDTADADTADPATIAADTAAADTAADGAPFEAPDARPLTALLLDGGTDGVFVVRESDVETVGRYLSLRGVQRLIPRNIELAWANEPESQGAALYRSLYVLEERPFMTGELLENASAGRDPRNNMTVVQFEMNRRGGRRFERTTREHMGELLAIVLDEEVVSAPVVRGVISTNGQIEMGQAPLAEAQDLALVLRAGALPAPLRIIEERTVGPSLGEDSVESGRLAGIVGIVFVVLIMLGYYRLAGLLAVGGLSVYVMIVLGGLSALAAELTLPGMAGLVLSIGMAVDANVLIFERIREELNAGRTTRTAVDEGFRHAMSAIIDSNLTTLITALILFQFGTGPVRGFAVTLSIGIIGSFFSAVYVTRALFLIYIRRKGATDPISI